MGGELCQKKGNDLDAIGVNTGVNAMWPGHGEDIFRDRYGTGSCWMWKLLEC